jgi:UDP-3-O-[3-hydroxymyristoyl] glucosamine N-acyltransferase
MITVIELDFVLIGFSESAVNRDVLRDIQLDNKDAYIITVDEFLSTGYNVDDKLFMVGYMNNSKTRQSVIDKIETYGIKCFSFVHPDAIVSNKVTLKKSTFVAAGANIQYGTIIDDYTFISPECFVSHDVTIGKNCYLSASVSVYGGVIINDNCYLSARCCILDMVTITNNVILLFNTNVRDNITLTGTYAGMTKARRIST